jgi:hypothetical protein
MTDLLAQFIVVPLLAPDANPSHHHKLKFRMQANFKRTSPRGNVNYSSI